MAPLSEKKNQRVLSQVQFLKGVQDAPDSPVHGLNHLTVGLGSALEVQVALDHLSRDSEGGVLGSLVGKVRSRVGHQQEEGTSLILLNKLESVVRDQVRGVAFFYGCLLTVPPVVDTRPVDVSLRIRIKLSPVFRMVVIISGLAG